MKPHVCLIGSVRHGRVAERKREVYVLRILMEPMCPMAVWQEGRQVYRVTTGVSAPGYSMADPSEESCNYLSSFEKAGLTDDSTHHGGMFAGSRAEAFGF